MTAARQVRFWLLGFVLFLVALYLLSAILLPFVAAMAVAYFLDPIVDRVEKAGLSRTLATTVVTAAFAILVIVALLLLVPLLHGQIVDLAEKLPGYLDALRARVLPLLQELERRVPTEGER